MISATEARPLFVLAGIQGYCDAILKTSTELGSIECAKKISALAAELIENGKAKLLGSTVDAGDERER